VQEDIMITDEQVVFYRDNGYLVVENVLSPPQVAALRREVEELVAGSAEVQEHTEVYDLEETHTLQRPRVRRIKTPHRWMSSVDELVTDPKLVGILTRLIGPGVRFQTSKLNMKAAGFGAPVEWHQDWAFYPHTNDDLLAVGIMLDDVDAENGPMLVIPGSHRGPVYDHHRDGYFCGAIDPQACALDVSQAVAVTAPAGSMSFHHVRLLHGSALNRSAHDRRLLLLQYTAVDAWPLVRPVQDVTAYDELIVAGEPTVAPRLAAVPVRLPLPPAPYQGSIYENQRGSARRYFDTYQETVRVGP
jgi:phytanoyl-CoA hydroxylase